MFTQLELNTILAALRYYQHEGMDDPANRPDWMDEIGCPDDCLDADEIDVLCQDLNFGGPVEPPYKAEADQLYNALELFVRATWNIGYAPGSDWASCRKGSYGWTYLNAQRVTAEYRKKTSLTR